MTDEYGYGGEAPPQYGDAPPGPIANQGHAAPPPRPPPREQQPTTASGEEPDAYDDGSIAAAQGKGEEATDGYFAPRMLRVVTLCCILLWFSILAMPHWFDNSNNKGKWKSAKDTRRVYSVHAAGIFFIFFGALVAICAQLAEWQKILERMRVVDFIVAVIIGFGAVLYFIGGCMFAQLINKHYDDYYDDHESVAGIAFMESCYVALVAIILAVDIAFDVLSKSLRLRTYTIFCTLIIFVSLILFFCYAIISGDKDFKDTKKQLGCVAAGWCFILLACICYLFAEFLPGIPNKELVVNIISAVHFLGCFIAFAGYWALGDERWDDAKHEDNHKAYMVGYGFFVLFVGSFMCTDISWGNFIKERAC